MAASDGREYRIGRSLARASRATGYEVVLVTYLVAGLAALATSAVADGHHPLTIALWADLAATAVVFAASMAVGNSSLYDPYWSVAPPVIVLAWVIHDRVTVATGNPVRQTVLICLVLIWAVRLTANWAMSWRGLGHEDWRYVQIRAQTRGRLPWWLVSLTGIQLMPTLVVFTGMLAAWPAVGAGSRPLSALDATALVTTVTAIAIEAIADRQLRRFTSDPANRGQVADRGLWRYSRHPNYLGEIGFWWGIWLFGLATAPSWWWTVVGPITMLALFLFVSVPMMDRRSLQRRPDYADRTGHLPPLLPLPRSRSRGAPLKPVTGPEVAPQLRDREEGRERG
jgi:steroid 5-alpha reductase family enzyme